MAEKKYWVSKDSFFGFLTPFVFYAVKADISVKYFEKYIDMI